MGNCSCVAVYYDGVQDFCNEKIMKARKVHKCCECGCEISPGQKYEKTTVKWNGDFSTYKTCLDCLSVRTQFFCGGWIYQCMWEHLSDHIDYVGTVESDCLANLTPLAREKVCELLDDYWIRTDELEEDH